MKVLGFSLMVALLIVPPELVASGDPGHPQESKLARQQRQKLIKEEGWRIPGTKEYVTVSSTHEKQFYGVTVGQRFFNAEARPVVDHDGNTVGSITSQGINVPLKIARSRKQLYDLRDFSTYDVNGNTFAYVITLVPLAIDERTRTYTGAMYRLLYFDEDGDGRFETRYSGFTMPRIPEWTSSRPKASPLDPD